MTDERLSRKRRLEIVAELGLQQGGYRADEARERAQQILGPSGKAPFTADYVLMRAIDRYAAGELSVEDLFRCRVLAYSMTFAEGGEEWARWGVAAEVRPGEFLPLPTEAELEDLPDPIPGGPPWRDG